MERITTVREVFFKCQTNIATHERCNKKLKEFFSADPNSQFFKDFIECLKELFIRKEKLPNIERAIDFAAKFCVSTNANDEDQLSPFMCLIMKFLFENHESNSKTVRNRICQFINKVLAYLPDEASLDDDICDDICETMMERLQDKTTSVRAEAVKALLRLQDPSNVNCPVIKAYVFHLSHDPSQEVRLAIISSISRSNITLPYIVERTRDVKPSVRIEAYRVLGKLNIKSFSIEQRERLLLDGLQDRDDKVKTSAVDFLLKSWFHNLNKNYIDLLHLLDVESSKDTAALVLKTLFEMELFEDLLAKLPIANRTKLIPLEKLTPQSAFLWHSLGNYFNNLTDSALESCVPELTHFCNYINSYLTLMKEAQNTDTWTQIQQNFILQQLFLLAKEFDLSDELGRSTLKELLVNALLSQCVKVNQVSVIVELMVEVIPDTNVRLQALAEVVSEIHEPMCEVPVQISEKENHELEMQKAAIRLKLMEAKEQLDTVVEQREFSKALNLNQDILELEKQLAASDIAAAPQTQEVRKVCNDSFTLCKCLTIIYEMMQAKAVTKLTPHLRSLLDNFVLNSVEVVDTNVLNAALKTVAVYGLLDEDLAKKYFLMFCLHLAEGTSQEISITSAKAIFDLLIKYGLSAFQITSETGAQSTTRKMASKKASCLLEFSTTDIDSNRIDDNITSTTENNSLIPVLLGILDSSDTVMRQLAAEGLSKLLLSGRIASAHVLTRLILLWFNPITSDDPLLHQMLGCFFNAFAVFVPGSPELIEEVFLPTLYILLNAPPSSPLANVDADRVADFMINLSRPGMNKKQHLNVHNNLVVRLCNEVQRLPQNAFNTTYLKASLKIAISIEDENVKADLLNIANKLVKAITDKTTIHYVKNLIALLQNGKTSLSRDQQSKAEPVNEEKSSQISSGKSRRKAKVQRKDTSNSSESDSDNSDRIHLRLQNLSLKKRSGTKHLPGRSESWDCPLLSPDKNTGCVTRSKSLAADKCLESKRTLKLKQMIQQESSTDGTDYDQQNSGFPGFVVPETPSDSSSDMSSDSDDVFTS